MFQIKSIIPICLAMTVLLACTTKTPPTENITDGDVMSIDASASIVEHVGWQQAAKEQAEQEQAAKEQAEQEQAAKEQAEQEQAAKEQAAKAQAALSDLQLRSGPGNPITGDEKSALCKGCHGNTGVSMDPLIPKLAGQYGKYIAKQVRNYQASIRTHQIMGAIAASVTDEDLADISAYFGAQSMMKGDTPSSNQVGENLFKNGDMTRMLVPCNNCHGATGKGQNPRNSVFPVIGGQHKEYLLGQLTNFKKGTRNNSPGGVMNIMVQHLSDAEIDALADYVSGL